MPAGLDQRRKERFTGDGAEAVDDYPHVDPAPCRRDQRVAYREGAFITSGFYPRAGCGDPPPGFSILAASAVPVLEALRISAEVVTNAPMRRAVEDAAVRVREGAPIARSIGASRLFPPMLVHLVASGETSGELEAMLERAADNQERELDGVVNTAVGILGPVMILLMGGFVFVIVVALLLPIFQLNQAVR